MTPEHNRFCNMLLDPPSGEEADVESLPVFDTGESLISFWRPSEAELAALLAGGLITLTIMGATHPPVLLDAIAPLKDAGP